MSKSKPALPAAPTEDAIKADIARQCAALGIELVVSRMDRVRKAVLEIVKKSGAPVKTSQVEKEVGFDAFHYLNKGVALGDFICVAPGQYIPRVVK